MFFIIPISFAGSIQGFVSDKSTGTGVEGVRIEFADQQYISKSNGSYSLTITQKGTHTISASKAGYKPYSNKIVVGDRDTVEHDIPLAHDFGFQF
jgi:hypothetical protein